MTSHILYALALYDYILYKFILKQEPKFLVELFIITNYLDKHFYSNCLY